MKLLLIHFAATWFLTGLIWFVHVVHYPLFDGVGEAEFSAWHARHVKQTGLVVILPMLIELGTAIALVATPPPGMRNAAIAGLVLLAVVWAATFLGAVPAHDKLSSGFDAVTHKRLLTADLIRTVAWSARAVLVSWFLYVVTKPIVET